MAPSLAVVTSGSEAEKELIETAADFSDCRGSELLVLRLATRDDYGEVSDTLETIGDVEGRSYTEDEINEGLKRNARELANDAIGDADVPVTVLLRIVDEDEHADTILEVARERECDHVFVVGQLRSPTGKALFGDVTQKVILNFDGNITLSME
ncbi:MAG: universal stress protein [Halorhabdus sp.]